LIGNIPNKRNAGRASYGEGNDDRTADYPQSWPVLKRVSSLKADADDPTLIEGVELAAA
jgi:hypothetical protein